MPDTIRASGGGFAGPRRSGFGRWLGAAAAAFRPLPAPTNFLRGVLQVYVEALTTSIATNWRRSPSRSA